jgi:hypothetical protein
VRKNNNEQKRRNKIGKIMNKLTKKEEKVEVGKDIKRDFNKIRQTT